MGGEPTARSPAAAALPAVEHLLAVAVDASPAAVARVELLDEDTPLAGVWRHAPAVTRVEHRLGDGTLRLIVAGDATIDELTSLAEVLAGPVLAAVDELRGTGPAHAHLDRALIDLTEIEQFEHRLRTRLTVARGWIDLLRKQRVPLEHSAGPLEITSRQLDEIEAMLRDGLVRSSVPPDAAGREGPTLDLLAAVWQTLEDAAWSHDRRVHGPLVEGEPRSVVVDGEALRDVLLHLLDNAVQHTPEGTRVDVRVVYRHGEVELAVEDAGPGFPAEHQGPGSGVGLRVVERLAGELGARLDFATSPGLGGAAVRLRWLR